MASITLSYKEQIIAELDGQGTRTLKTAGKFCEADIVLDFVCRCPGAAPVTSYCMVDFFRDFIPDTMAEEAISGQEEE